jgi:hypothetical protein
METVFRKKFYMSGAEEKSPAAAGLFFPKNKQYYSYCFWVSGMAVAAASAFTPV